MKKLISLLVLIFTLQIGFAQTPEAVFNKVSTAVKSGDAQAMSEMFNSSIEVTVPGTDQAYSAQQAQFVIKKFFTNHPVKSFKVMHKGNSGATHYETGTLITSNGTFDVNIFIKKIGDKHLITQVRFEEE